MTVTVDDFVSWLRQQAPNRRFQRTSGECALVAYFNERCDRHDHYYVVGCILEQFHDNGEPCHKRHCRQAHRVVFGRKEEIIHNSYSVCYRLSEGELALVDRVSAMLADDRYTVSELLVAMQRAEVNDKEVSCPSHRRS
jgi:hypothetical protein